MTSDGQEIQSKKVHSTPIILDDRQLKVAKSKNVFSFCVSGFWCGFESGCCYGYKNVFSAF